MRTGKMVGCLLKVDILLKKRETLNTAFGERCWRRTLIFWESRSVDQSQKVLSQELQFSIVADDIKLIAVRFR